MIDEIWHEIPHHYPGIEKDFEIGKHLDTYRNTREMLNKINHYLANPTQREQIAINGKAEEISEEHSVKDKLSILAVRLNIQNSH